MLKYITLFTFAFFLGKFSYGIAPDSDGFGIFVPNLGGYHVSLINSEDTGFYHG